MSLAVLNQLESSIETKFLSLSQLADFLEIPAKDNRLPKKLHCPIEVYNVMLECWESRAVDRPTFKQLSERMGQLLALAQRKSTQPRMPSAS